MFVCVSSTKLEVHNISLCRQRRIKPQPQVTCSENLMKYGQVVPEICGRKTNKQRGKWTDMLIAIIHSPAKAGLFIKMPLMVN